MSDILANLKVTAEKDLPNFTGSIEIHMFDGQVGTMEKKEKRRYALKNKPSVAQGADMFHQ